MSESVEAPVRLPRKVVPSYLAERWGYQISAISLAQYAHKGVGPKHFLVRNRAYYTPEQLDQWMIENTRPSK
jgi:hypothetical protein